jgi:hypothetical protein
MAKEGLNISVNKDAVYQVENSNFFEHSLEENPYAEDPLKTAKGFMMGVLISIPLWMLILALIFFWEHPPLY